jgi:hypothetical protein
VSSQKFSCKDEDMTEMPGNQPPLGDPTPPATPAQTYTPPVATSSEPAAVQSPALSYAPPVAHYPQGVYPPPKKGPSALKIVLIVVGILFGLGIIAVGVAGFAVYKVAKSANMTTSSHPVTAADLGVPLYPGAVPGKSVHMTIMGKDMITANFVSADPTDQVLAFYKSNLGAGAVEVTSFNGESLRLDKGAGESVTVSVSDQPGSMVGRTQIVVVNIGKAASSSN